MVDEHTTREELITRMRLQRQKITKYFNDVELSNAIRRWDEVAMNPDPYGLIAQMARALDTSLAHEVTRAARLNRGDITTI